MDNVTAALLITVLVHFLGIWVLVWALFDGETPDIRGWWRGDDPRDEWPEPPVGPAGGGGGLPVPLPDAEPARVRLREPGRIGAAYPRPERRPAHVPAPERAPDRELV